MINISDDMNNWQLISLGKIFETHIYRNSDTIDKSI